MPRIDGTHHAFKRKSSLGPGPRKRARISQAKEWECQKAKGKKYVQICRYVGPGKTRKPRKVVTDKAWKKQYNKTYRAWAKNKRVGTGPAKSGYRCRSTTVSKCK